MPSTTAGTRPAAAFIVGLAAASLGLAIGSGVSPVLLLGLLVFVGSLLLALWRLDALVVLAVSAFLLPSLRVGGAALLLSARWIVYVALLFVLVLRIMGVRTRGPYRFRRPLPVLALAGLASVSVVWSVSPTLTLGRGATFTGLVLAILLIRALPDGARQVRVSLQAVAAAVALANVAGVAVGGAGARYSGLFANPNTVGVATALLFPLALNQAFNGSTSRNRLFFTMIAGLLAAEAAAAASRGGMLAIAASYLVLGAVRLRPRGSPRRMALYLLPAVVAVAVAFMVVDPHRFSTKNTREDLWGIAPELFNQRPVGGTGFGTTQVVLIPYSSRTGYSDPRGVDFHNSYLNLLVDLGSLGVASFAGVLALAWRRRKEASALVVGIVVAGLTSGFFESWMFSVGSGFSFVFWFALVDLASGKARSARNQVVRATYSLPRV